MLRQSITPLRRVLTSLSLLLLGVTLFGCSPKRLSSGFKPPTHQEFSLPNGLKVVFLKNDELPLVNGALYLRGGALLEPQEIRGSFNALSSLWRFGGAGRYSADQLDAELDALSASISTSVGQEFSSVSFGCLASALPQTLDLFSEVVLHPRFEESRFSLWRSQALEEVRRRRDSPGTIAGISFNQLLFGSNTPYGRVLTSKEIEAVSREQLLEAHRSLIIPNGAVLVVSGAVELDTLRATLEERFGNWARGTAYADLSPALAFEPTPAVYFIEHPASQASVFIGHQGPKRLSPDHIAIEGFNQIFGSGFFGSRLTLKVRTELGLVYGIGGGIAPGAERGRAVVTFQTKGPSTGEAIAASLNELKRLRDDPVPIAELDEVIRSISNSHIFKFDSQEDIVTRIATLHLLEYPEDYDQRYLSRVAALTPEKIQAVALNRWEPEKLLVVVVGNQSAFQALEEMLKNPPEYLAGRKLVRLRFNEQIESAAEGSL